MCLGELGLSLDYLYSMTMAEFNIRLFAFTRMTKNREKLFREVAFASLIGSHQNAKKLPKNRESYWKIDGITKIDKEKQAHLKHISDMAVQIYKQQTSK